MKNTRKKKETKEVEKRVSDGKDWEKRRRKRWKRRNITQTRSRGKKEVESSAVQE